MPVYPDGKVLLGRSDKFNNQWVVFGGHLEPGEDLRDCAIRETKEETGLDVINPLMVIVQQEINPEEYKEPAHFIFFNFTVDVVDAKSPIILNSEFQEHCIINPEEFLLLDLNPSSRRFIEYYIATKDEQRRSDWLV